MKPTAADIELKVAYFFNARRNFIIPNVSFGFRSIPYEVDVMVITSSLYAYDVEIKVSASDLKRDQKKRKWQLEYKNYWRKHYFAIPIELTACAEFIPDFAGILTVRHDDNRNLFLVSEYRPAQVNKSAKKITEKEYAALGRLCMLRLWDAKTVINNRVNGLM